MYISVVIPVLNAENMIGLQLQALSQQQVDFDWEVIVVDNGSKDKTVDVVSSYSDRLQNLTIVQASEKPSAAYARNIGATHAKGDFFAFCDADDVVEHDWLHFIGAALKHHPFVAGRLCSSHINDKWQLQLRAPTQETGLQKGTFLPHAASCNLAIQRSVFEAAGGFDTSMLSLEDTDFCWKVQLTGVELYFEEQAVVHYRFRTSIYKLFKQFRMFGKYSIFLDKRYRPFGKTPKKVDTEIRQWLNLLRRLRYLDSKQKLGVWMRDLGWHLGALQGRIHYWHWS